MRDLRANNDNLSPLVVFISIIHVYIRFILYLNTYVQRLHLDGISANKNKVVYVLYLFKYQHSMV